MEWTKEEILDHINTNGFFASSKLNGISIGPSIYTNPPLPGEIGLLPYTTSHSHPTQNTRNVEPNELEALPTLEVPQELTEPAEPAVKHGQRHPQKHPVTENPITENHLTSAGTSVRQSPPADISVLVQEAYFTDSRRKEIIKTSDEDKTQVDSGGNRQVDSGGNQGQAIDQEELNP
jgi:hypothetical protein